MLNLTIKELNLKLKNKEITSEELTKFYFERIKKVDWDISAYITITEKEALQKAKEIDKKWDFSNPLTWIPYSLKDIICTKWIKTTAASKMLENFIPPYNATVAEKIDNWVCLWKVNCDEFAMGSSCENSAFFPTKNPWDLERVPWWSSGWSAASVASSQCVFSLWTDTWGSIRQPASFCWVVWLKPTYWRVSRSWVISYGSSLDTIWPITKTVEDCAIVMNAISWDDKKDSTTPNIEVPNYLDWIDWDLKWKKIAYLKEFMEADWFDPKIKKEIENTLKTLEKLWCIIEEVSIPELKYAIDSYYLIAKSEASSNLSRYDWVRYWYQAKIEWKSELKDIYIQSRSKWFWPEVKRAIMLWTFTLSAGYFEAYYKKAAKVRNVLKQAFEKVFENYSAILAPVAPSIAFKIWEMTKNPLEMYLQDIFTVPINLVWVPSLSIPVWMVDNMPVWAQIIWKQFNESEILNIWNILEKEIKFERKLV